MAATDLCTVAQVRAHHQFPSGDVALDPVIGDLITRWSRFIMAHTEREFAPAVTATTRRFIHNGTGFLDLAPYDLRSATSVQVLEQDGTVEDTLTAADDYELWPYPNAEGVFRALEFTSTVGKRVQVTGNWGWTSVPEPVAEACILAVIATLQESVQAFGGPLQPNSLGVGVNDAVALPPGIRGLLAPYRR